MIEIAPGDIQMLKVDSDRLLETLDELSEIGATGDGGISRVCLSPSEVEARKYVFGLMEEAGLDTYIDSVGNVLGCLWSDSKVEPVLAGSHLDSVVNGGRLDGSYGVLAGIEALRTIRESGLSLRRPLVGVCFENEEGVRFPALTGSKYVAGLIDAKRTYSLRDSEGITFGKALAESNLELCDKDLIKGGNGNLHAFVELHIEQGPVLDQERVSIGVVETIVGIAQYDFLVEGSADHAGTTPMNTRKDALVAASKIVLSVKQLAEKFGHGTVGTVGSLEVWPGAPNVVPSRVRFTTDIRSSSDHELLLLEEAIRLSANQIANEVGVNIDLSPRLRLAPTRMAGRIVNLIESTAKELELSFRTMQSGAGHDAMIMSCVTDTGMIFVPSKAGKSHSPAEATDPENLVNGTNVFANVLAKLAGQDSSQDWRSPFLPQN